MHNKLLISLSKLKRLKMSLLPVMVVLGKHWRARWRGHDRAGAAGAGAGVSGGGRARGVVLEDGLEGFGRHLKEVMASGTATEYEKVHHLIGQGNFVVTYSHTRIRGDDYAVFDIFRLQDGKIVEHWDVQEKIGPRETWNNQGKF